MLRRLLRRRQLRRPQPNGRQAVHRTEAVTARHTAGRQISYSPSLDGAADPGEIVWTMVAYEDRPFQAKDRPVLIVARRDERTLFGLMLSSRDHAGDPRWYGLGPGAWDKQNRPSWVRLDRILELHESSLRREAAVLDQRRFNNVAALLRRDYGWR
jgi:hypothetical protein